MLQLASTQLEKHSLSICEPQTVKIVLDASEPIEDDIEVRSIFIGSTETNSFDQVLSEDLIGPIPAGKISFDIELSPIDIQKVNLDTFFGLTSIVIMLRYRGEEFLRIGYFVRIGYPGIDNLENYVDEGEEISDEDESDFEENSGGDEEKDDEEKEEGLDDEQKVEELADEQKDDKLVDEENDEESGEEQKNEELGEDEKDEESGEDQKDEELGDEQIKNKDFEKQDDFIPLNEEPLNLQERGNTITHNIPEEYIDIKTPNLKDLFEVPPSSEGIPENNPQLMNAMTNLHSVEQENSSDKSTVSDSMLDTEDLLEKKELLSENINVAYFIDTEKLQYKEHILEIKNICIEYCEPPLRTIMDINWKEEAVNPLDQESLEPQIEDIDADEQ